MARPYFTPLLVLILFISFKVTSQQLGVVPFTEGEDLVVNCNADAVGLDTSVTQILSVTLNHVADNQDNTLNEVAFIRQRNGITPGLSRTGPDFNEWAFAMPSQNTLSVQIAGSNREAMTIGATKTNAKCSDGGVFSCVVSGNDMDGERSTNYTGRGTIKIDDMTVFSNGELSNNTFKENATMTLTCRGDGPENYEFRWHKRCPTNNLITPQFDNWPNPNDIEEKTSSIKLDENGRENDCGTYRHIQRLVFNAQPEDNNCDIRCQFGTVQSGFNAHSKTRTILVKREDVIVTGPVTPNSTSEDDGGTGKSSSASVNSLAIGLGVGIGLIVIIIIVVLVYVFFFHKRNKDNKYKDNGRDQPDANNHASDVPPPMFYSKPKKQPKSEKNDARGASSVGSEDSYPPYEKDFRRKPYYDADENPDLDPAADPRVAAVAAAAARSGRRRSNRRSRGNSVDDSDRDPQPRRYPSDDGRRSYGDDPRYTYEDGHPYASTDISRSEDEFSDASGRPKPKRRTKYTPKDENEEKVLQYADLDLPQRQAGRRDDDRADRDDSQDPIHYASIRV